MGKGKQLFVKFGKTDYLLTDSDKNNKLIFKVVVLGGGTGSFVVASGLRDLSTIQTAVLLSMADNGGSNKIIRDQFGLLPTSGVRQAIVALSTNRTFLRQLFTYRFSKGGTGLTGMTFGNLFMLAMTDLLGSQSKAIQETCKLLQVRGKIIPITYDNVQLVAQYENGLQVVGEHQIDQPTHDGRIKIKKLSTLPSAKISNEAKQALLSADLIILGPGDFYTNTIANLVVDGVTNAIMISQAKVAFIANLMTKYGENYNYTLTDCLRDLDNYLPLSRLSHLIINSQKIPDQILVKYRKQQSIPISDDLDLQDDDFHALLEKVIIIRANLLSSEIIPQELGDQLNRSLLRHDAGRLANILMQILNLSVG